ncbi:hypothetical protein NONI108955_08970 [Nocardia ninae]
MSVGLTWRTNCTSPVRLVSRPEVKFNAPCSSTPPISEILAIQRSVNGGSLGALSVAAAKALTAMEAPLSR